jgi:hypothetical protein
MHACEVRDLPVTRVRENLPAPRPSDLSRTAPAADSGSPKAEHLLLDRCAYAVRTYRRRSPVTERSAGFGISGRWC